MNVGHAHWRFYFISPLNVGALAPTGIWEKLELK
uniref:Uncharacterized protein n=1 Tax=Rhizophora mucronata TaxID=61149 RepID=A0A2P2N2X7_RHIMU